MADGLGDKYYSDAEKASFRAGKAAAAKKRKPAGSKKKGKKPYRRQTQYGGHGSRAIVSYPNVVAGYGDYRMNPADSYGKQWGGMAGSYLGELLGGGAQTLLGSLVGGLGEYKVKHNALLTPDPPTIINDSVKGGITFRHKEYLRDIITSSTPGAFSLDSYLINPGNSKTFPWLSQVAANFEQYSIEGMIFEFRSMSADALNSTNTALGTVIMATNYDAIDTLFKAKGEMENYEWGMSCKPSVNMLHPIECAPRQTSVTELYVLDGPVPSGADPRLYHWGNMQIATNGFQGASVNIGELWVTYQVRLLKPKIFQAIGAEIGSYYSQNTSYTNALPLGNGTLTVLGDTLGPFVDPPNRNIGFPVSGMRKHYQVILRWQGTIAAITLPLLTFTNCVNTSFITVAGPANGESCTSVVYTISLMCDANILPVLTIGAAGTLPATGNQMRIWISEINPFTF